MVGAEVLAGQSRGALEEADRAFVLSDTAIRVTNRSQNLRLD